MLGRERQGPIPGDTRGRVGLAGVKLEHFRSVEFARAANDGVGRRHIFEGQVAAERHGIHPAIHGGDGQQRLELRPKSQQARLAAIAGDQGVVEGLLAHAIARGEQPPLAGVPDGESEHAIDAVEQPSAPVAVAVHQHLCVRARAKAISGRAKLVAKLLEVVDLAIEHDLHQAVFAAHGLRGGLAEIDHREPAVAQAHAWRQPYPFPVRAARGERRHHLEQEILVYRSPRGIQQSGDSAHQPARGWPRPWRTARAAASRFTVCRTKYVGLAEASW